MPARRWRMRRRRGRQHHGAERRSGRAGAVHRAIWRGARRRPIGQRCNASSRSTSAPTWPRIKVPVLCLAAEHDRNAPWPVVEKMAGKIPGACYFCLPGARPHAEPRGARGLRCRDLQFSRPCARPTPLIVSRSMNRPPSTRTTATRRSSIPPPSADDEEAALIAKARRFGRARAGAARRPATIATRPSRSRTTATCIAKACSRICIPKEDGGLGAGFRTYCLAAAELGRYCGATALSWNMHVCSTLWTGALADDLEMTRRSAAEHNARRARALPPHRRGRRDLFAALLRRRRGGGRRGGLRHRGEAGRGRLSRQRQEDLRLARRARPTTTACSAPSAPRARTPAAATRSISPSRANAPGVIGGRRLGPARHARHGLAHAALQGRVRARGASC